ncbi:MAG: hypothetical protein HeimC2_12870 [Candidatus Heimdallarchaeota archaeon LC_2]|nr:MAG: hypothetical protein HeimC2_12870 [Candidatus Heimdallarchaeota archaeon LC_2]
MIVKNETTISVFINEVTIVEHVIVSIQGSYNYFGIGTARPISFDNFRVAKDLSALEDDTSSTPAKDDTGIPHEDSSDDGFITTTNIGITLGTFTLLGLSYKFYFSKKKSLKI